MAVALTPQVPPIAADADGVLRVSGTRVTIDTIVGAFERGATPEEIAGQYPVVPLPDVYAVIAYYLGHRAEIDAYLAARLKAENEIRDVFREQQDAAGVRQRLLARRSGRA